MMENEGEKRQNRLISFLCDLLRGVAIGVAFIIPGFSGGSVAAILGIYEKLVGAIADLPRRFKPSALTLLPIVLGMLLGVAALIVPIRLALGSYPIPTVTLFVGLALGGLPSVTGKLRGERPRPVHLGVGALSLAFAALLAFLPHGSAVDLFHLGFGGYLLLVLVGIAGSAALVVPGISGSMLLLIFGYYEPIVRLVTEELFRGQQIGICILVLVCLAAGLLIGFFGVSVLMRFLLRKFPRGVRFAITGFILGSVPAVYASVIRDTGTMLFSSPWYWAVSAVMLPLGIALSLGLFLLAKRKK